MQYKVVENVLIKNHDDLVKEYYSIGEVISILGKNPEKKFRIAYDEQYTSYITVKRDKVVWEGGDNTGQPFIITFNDWIIEDRWVEVVEKEREITWEEAFQRWVDDRLGFKVIHNGKEYIQNKDEVLGVLYHENELAFGFNSGMFKYGKFYTIG